MSIYGNKVKISTQNLNLYYGENHALKILIWTFMKIRSLHLSDHPDVEIYVFKNIKPHE